MKVGDMVKYSSPGNRWDHPYAWGIVLSFAKDFHGREDGGVFVYWNSTRTKALATRQNLELFEKK
jgi:hypothetical protein